MPPKIYTPADILSMPRQSIQIVDTRDVELFAVKHIPGSLHLPLVQNFITYSKAILDPSKPIILVLEDDNNFPYIERLLTQSCYTTVLGYLKGGITHWNYPTETLPTVSTEELTHLLKAANTTLIDVRTEPEFNAEHIANAIHYPLGMYDENKAKAIPAENQLYLICGGGTRSSIMASNFKIHGIKNVHNVRGGMSAWKAIF